MYYVIKNGPNVQLGVDANGAIETIAGFTSGPTLKTRDLAILADEMVAVLNRDLENRANDIAATPENIATAHLPDYSVPGEATAADDVCDNPECACGGVEDPTDPTSTAKPPIKETKVPADRLTMMNGDGMVKRRYPDVDWATDDTGLPVLERAGEIKEFPDVTVVGVDDVPAGVDSFEDKD